MSEEMLIRHCSPTLAGIKTANMFTCCFENPEDIKRDIRKLNSMLVKNGLKALPLRFSGNRALIYVYRPTRLTEDLKTVQPAASCPGWDMKEKPPGSVLYI